ncbi:MAG: class I SAM-dependent methyltransferase [Acidobacteriota bacterium]
MRAQTLRNLAETDWNESPIVVQEQGPSDRKQDRITHNALCTLRAGCSSGQDFILFLEDDLDFNRHLRHNLTSWFPIACSRPGNHFFGSLYNPGIGVRERHPRHRSFIARPETVYGSQAYILSRATAAFVMEHWDEVPGMGDIKMPRLAARVCDIHYSWPSLVQHVGVSSVWGGGFHNAPDFDRNWRFEVMKQPYPREFFLSLRESSLRTARIVAPLVMDAVRPSRVVDVGCAGGAWLAAFQEHGAREITGVDDEQIPADLLLIPPDRIQRRDLGESLALGFQADLMISLEVGQQLPASAAAGYVASLTEAGPVILFSAAIPGQGGHCHVNEQWPDYWARLFAERGYVPVDILRPQVWDDARIPFWYRQNLLLYVREKDLPKYPRLGRSLPGPPMALVHPDLFLLRSR